jgi:hypothetical protein
MPKSDRPLPGHCLLLGSLLGCAAAQIVQLAVLAVQVHEEGLWLQ